MGCVMQRNRKDNVRGDADELIQERERIIAYMANIACARTNQYKASRSSSRRGEGMNGASCSAFLACRSNALRTQPIR